jgi:hypothetical protein
MNGIFKAEGSLAQFDRSPAQGSGIIDRRLYGQMGPAGKITGGFTYMYDGFFHSVPPLHIVEASLSVYHWRNSRDDGINSSYTGRMLIILRHRSEWKAAAGPF